MDYPGASGVRWHGHVLKRDNDEVLRRALDFEVRGKKRAWATECDVEKAVEEHIGKI